MEQRKAQDERSWSRIEGTRLLLNEARERLEAMGYDDDEMAELVDRFTKQEQTADVEQFLAWVKHQHIER